MAWPNLRVILAFLNRCFMPGELKKRLSGSPIENQKTQQAEMARLKREVARLSQENAFLKNAATYFAKDQ